MKRFKNWLIRKLGGYTFGEMDKVANLYCESEIFLRHYMTDAEGSGARYLAAKTEVIMELSHRVDDFFIHVVGYRGHHQPAWLRGRAKSFSFETKHYSWSVVFYPDNYELHWLPNGGSAQGRLASQKLKGWRYQWLRFALTVIRERKQPPKPF